MAAELGRRVCCNTLEELAKINRLGKVGSGRFYLSLKNVLLACPPGNKTANWEARYFFVRIDRASVGNPDWPIRSGWNVNIARHFTLRAFPDGFVDLRDRLSTLQYQWWPENFPAERIRRAAARIQSGRYDLPLVPALGPFLPGPARTEKSSRAGKPKADDVERKKKKKAVEEKTSKAKAVAETPPVAPGKGKGLMSSGANPNAKLLNYRDRMARQMEEYRKKREDEKRREEEEKRREEEERRENEVPRTDAEALPDVDLDVIVEVATSPAVRVSSPIGSPSDNIPLAVRQEALATARLGKRARPDESEESARKRANIEVAGPSALVVDAGTEGAARGQQDGLVSSEFDLEFSFKGEGKRLSDFPDKCAELLSGVKSGESFPVVPTAGDLFGEAAYSSWAQQAIQMVASTNRMVQYFDHCQKAARERSEERQRHAERRQDQLDMCRKTIRMQREALESFELSQQVLKGELAKEKAANDELRAKLKSEKERLRNSRAFEVAKERELAEERVRSQAEMKLGKLKCYFDAMDSVFEKQTYLNQATCLKGVYEDQEKGQVITPEWKEIIEADLKRLPEEIKEIGVVKIVPDDFQMSPNEDGMPVEQWVSPSPASEGTPLPIQVVDEVDPQTGDQLDPLFPSDIAP